MSTYVFTTRQKIYLPFKRLIGILGSIVGIVFCLALLWWWVFPINAIVTKGHPVFVHKRIGKNKKVFKLLKFRSMRMDADPNLAPSDMDQKKQKSMETGFGGGTNATTQLPNRFMCGYSTKMTTPFHHPDAQYGNKATYMLAGTGGKTFTDQYFFRLAEAYLLRAEAYINKGQKAEAAADINVLRQRAQAKTVTAEEMSIDFILDERLRELVCEEKRRLTLARTGKLSERIKKYNPYFSAAHSADGKDYDAHFDLLPIPLSAIQANKDAALQQNPGY